MKTTLCLISAALLISTALSHEKPVLTSENSAKIASPKGRTQLVKGWGFGSDAFSVANWGVQYKFSLDVFGGYEAPVFHLNSGENFVVTNPKLYLEAANHLVLQVNLGVFSFRITNDLTGYRFNFVDLSYLWSIDDNTKYCYGVDWSTTGFENVVGSEQIVNECQFGALGLLIGNPRDCKVRRYVPTQPIW